MPISEFDFDVAAMNRSRRNVKNEIWGFTNVTECMHLQYYFYPQRTGEEQAKCRTLVVDMYLSEPGIESMEMNELFTNP